MCRSDARQVSVIHLSACDLALVVPSDDVCVKASIREATHSANVRSTCDSTGVGGVGGSPNLSRGTAGMDQNTARRTARLPGPPMHNDESLMLPS